MPRGGKREGAGAKPSDLGPTSRLHLRLDALFLDRIDLARARLRNDRDDDGASPMSRAEFFRRSLPALLERLRAGDRFEPAEIGASDRPFPINLPLDLRADLDAAVAAGLAPSLADLVRAGGAALAREVLGVTA